MINIGQITANILKLNTDENRNANPSTSKNIAPIKCLRLSINTPKNIKISGHRLNTSNPNKLIPS